MFISDRLKGLIQIRNRVYDVAECLNNVAVALRRSVPLGLLDPDDWTVWRVNFGAWAEELARLEAEISRASEALAKVIQALEEEYTQPDDFSC